MINREQFKHNLKRSLISATDYSRKVVDKIDPDYDDIEGRKWAKKLIDEWEQSIIDIDEELEDEMSTS